MNSCIFQHGITFNNMSNFDCHMGHVSGRNSLFNNATLALEKTNTTYDWMVDTLLCVNN